MGPQRQARVATASDAAAPRSSAAPLAPTVAALADLCVGLGFGVQGLWGLEFMFRVWAQGLGVWGLRIAFQGYGVGSRLWVEASGCRV